MWATHPDLQYLRALGCALVMPHMKRTADAATLQATTWAEMSEENISCWCDCSTLSWKICWEKVLPLLLNRNRKVSTVSSCCHMPAQHEVNCVLQTASCVWLALAVFGCFWSLYNHRKSLVHVVVNQTGQTEQTNFYHSFLFADDVVLLISLSHDLWVALGWFEVECEVAGMQFSSSKSEAMVLSWTKVACPLQISNELLLLEFCSKVKGKCSRWSMNRLVWTLNLQMLSPIDSHKLWQVTKGTILPMQTREMSSIWRVPGLGLRNRMRSLDIWD